MRLVPLGDWGLGAVRGPSWQSVLLPRGHMAPIPLEAPESPWWGKLTSQCVHVCARASVYMCACVHA